jgi:hypothetical protein
MEDIFKISQDEQRVQIQVKNPDLKQSFSFTIKNVSAEEVYNRIFFLFKMLEAQEGEVKIVHYNTKNKIRVIKNGKEEYEK